MNSFKGARIGILEARMGSEMARLIEKYGGAVIFAPALREETTDCRREVSALIDRLGETALEFVIFQTGRGVSVLLDEAEKLGRREELAALLNEKRIVCRGPKPTAVCHRAGLRIGVQVKEPFTTADLIRALDDERIEAKKVAVINYGESNQALTDYLTSRGAQILELLLYRWELPEQTAPLENLIREIVKGSIDAVAFTSQVQARHLFRVAAEMRLADQLRRALREKTLVASIGPTCSAALRGFEIEPGVEPERPKMAHLVLSLIGRFE